MPGIQSTTSKSTVIITIIAIIQLIQLPALTLVTHQKRCSTIMTLEVDGPLLLSFSHIWNSVKLNFDSTFHLTTSLVLQSVFSPIFAMIISNLFFQSFFLSLYLANTLTPQTSWTRMKQTQTSLHFSEKPKGIKEEFPQILASRTTKLPESITILLLVMSREACFLPRIGLHCALNPISSYLWQTLHYRFSSASTSFLPRVFLYTSSNFSHL